MRAAAHAAISGVSAFAIVAILKDGHPEARLPHPAFAAVVAALASGLPDLFEPANSPHHRQLCHSVAFASVMASAMKSLYAWMPTTPGEVLVRDVLLSVGFGYMAHLCADATTAMGLPLVGNIC
jgi:membrane-bound metal-dependent hydrolase YbcI (DUF457 family)